MKRLQIILIISLLLAALPAAAQKHHFDGNRDDRIGDSNAFEPYHMKGMHGKKMPPKYIERIMNSLENEFPEFYKKLDLVRKEHPAVFDRTMHKFGRFMKNKNKNKEEKSLLISIFKEELETDLLIEKYLNEQDAGKKEALQKEILAKMSVTFDKKEQMKLELIKNIERTLEKKKKIFDERKLRKDEIIKNEFMKFFEHREKRDQMFEPEDFELQDE